MQDFCHLHVHTEYSLLDGAARIKKLVAKAKDLGMKALAITDHGVMYGVLDFYKECQKQGIKPIIGCEVYVAPRTMHDKAPHFDDNQYHLVLLAKDNEGYQNLLKLVSLGYIEGFYYKPRIDRNVLRQYSKGLIGLSACLAGEIPQNILEGKIEQAKKLCLEYLDILGEGNFYLELQDHGMQEQVLVNQELLKLSKELSIPLVATNDLHYVEREDARVQDILLCIQTGKTIDDPGRMRFSTDQFYLRSGEEMAALFPYAPEAIENTLKIADLCNVELIFGEFHLPHYEIPGNMDANEYIRKLCLERVGQRYNPVTEEIMERLEYELNVIKEMGYSTYFLIVWDFIDYARKKGIMVGPGRGSAAGSLVAYVLGITNIDPLRYDLLFERFLNPERVSMPDIDVDFCFERRGEVIDYVINKYGEDKVAQIVTFGTMAAKGAVRDVGRAMNLSYGEVDKIAKLIPGELGMSIEKALNISPELREVYNQDEQVRELIDTAKAVEGMARHASVHAAGVVISEDPLTSYVPLLKTSDGAIVTQYSKDLLEEIGLLKMDFLGLRTLTVIDDALKMIEKNHGVKIDIDNIPLDDKTTYDMLSSGETIGVFQLESSGMRSLVKDLKPEVIDDIIALVALYRPGPLGSGMVEDFVKRKHGEKKIEYLDPILEPILKDTYGVILYQEQVMRIASDMAGFSLGKADLLRRAMGKKKPEVIAAERENFIKGSVNNGIKEEIAAEIFDLMAHFADYGFNKSHSAAYGIVSYQTAYLKANYPLEYMAALLTSVMTATDKVALYIDECRRMGISILPPDINESLAGFTVVGGAIRFGLAAVKNVGMSVIEHIVDIRERDGKFNSFSDFLNRIDLKQVNKRSLESLIKCGAFDSFGAYRSQLLQVLDKAIEFAQERQKERLSGQTSLFDLLDAGQDNALEIPLPRIPEFPKSDLLALEKEMLGLYVSGHPLEPFEKELRKRISVNIGELKDEKEKSKVIAGGIITGSKKIITKNGQMMAFFVLEDFTGTAEVVVFPRTYENFAHLIKDDLVVIVQGRVSKQDEEVKIICESITPLNAGKSKELYIQFKEDGDLLLFQKLKNILLHYPGDCPVYLFLKNKKKLILTDRSFWVSITEQLSKDIKELLGEDAVSVKVS
ncbi:MAG TPA: DNA polymerase III subunit alpha [Clostridia bacterium]|nr:DNA polymerase III subunit alpha [Clostridia bacterium]